MKINREWHLEHRMPPRPSLEERIQWHTEHAKHCHCRPIPPKLQEIIEERNQAKALHKKSTGC